MREIEDLLHRARAEEQPAPPDARFTRAAVLRRIKQQEPSSADRGDILPAALAVGLLVLFASALYLVGRPHWLLVLVPLAAALSLCPLLLGKGEFR